MINDVLENIDIVEKVKDELVENKSSNTGSKEIIKIRCRHCDCLNDEDSKFCKQCGKEI